MALTIGIGRNVKSEPMRTRDWEQFRAAVDASLYDRKLHPVFYGTGIGEYMGELEDSACWVVAEYSDAQVELLRHDLARLAQYFGQDSIALTIGETEFIEARVL